jgi:phosphoglycerol transferase
LLDAACAAGAALVSAIVAIATLGLGDDTWRRPLDLANDANLNAMLVKGVVDHGWALENPNLGAPFTQQLHDFPFADNLSLVLIRVLAIFTSDWALVMNLFFVLTFALVAITAYAVARTFAVGRLPATALAILYAVTPYHFLRGEQHLFLSNYATVPLAVGLLLAAARGRGWRWNRTAIVVAAVAGFVLAGSVQYYPLFTVGLLVVVAVARALARRQWREALPGAALAAWIVASFALHLAPNLWYRFTHGANTDVAQRTREHG